MNVLEINDLRMSFADHEVLKGFTIAVPENSIFGFVRKNGAGKTTTMKNVVGLVKPDSGRRSAASQ